MKMKVNYTNKTNVTVRDRSKANCTIKKEIAKVSEKNADRRNTQSTDPGSRYETNHNSKLIALYIRVSTENQAEEGYSLEAQEKILRAECTAKEYDEALVKAYVDAGASGSNIERPALKQLIDDCREGLVSTVIVYKLDRLSRSQKDTLFLIEDVFIPNGIDFVSVNERLDTGSPYGKAMIGILSAFAQLERESIFLRTRMGMRERVRAGLWPGGGKVPFGYDYDAASGILVPNGDADTVRKLYELYLSGYSLARIARILGLKYEAHARQILLRKSNTGIITFNGEEYKGQHEPLIDTDTYRRAISEFERRSAINQKGAPSHLLTGLLICGHCGAKMRYQKWTKDGRFKLNCYSHDRSKPHLVKDPDCPSVPVWAADLEAAVLSDLWSIPYKAPSGNLPAAPDLLASLRDAESRQARKLRRLYDLYADFDDASHELILLESIEEAKSALASIREEIAREEKSGELSARRKTVEKEITETENLWEFMTFDEKRMFLKSLINSITITDDNVDIDYNL